MRRRKPPKREVLVKLTREERQVIESGQLRLNEFAAVTRMLAEGQRFIWYKLLNKYKITDAYDYDAATGNVYKKEQN